MWWQILARCYGKARYNRLYFYVKNQFVRWLQNIEWKRNDLKLISCWFRYCLKLKEPCICICQCSLWWRRRAYFVRTGYESNLFDCGNQAIDLITVIIVKMKAWPVVRYDGWFKLHGDHYNFNAFFFSIKKQ